MGFFGRAATGIARFGQHVGSTVHRLGHISAGVVRKFGQGVGKGIRVAHAIDKSLGGVLSKTAVGAAAFEVAHRVPGLAKRVARTLDRVSGHGQDIADIAQTSKGGTGVG